ncbi:Ig-like domain-containing protein [Conexibacter woesei]|uniref:Carboxypeptidase regulatory-like domain-containing protein n=1 Tax=Conexibacter woesei (strain DSM 14684 / CCUG 47730 / CIP 108061 / JCM 11494 / NBRC 100937 / ID131577) TaxID=469383 RepID=D3FEJ4_CONWI|nr:hypothetical protein [Conexibacter woesei]ADB49668.1 hypothetical protein Cwoe_1239 [Conexibacter woesei DSM 14684]
MRSTNAEAHRRRLGLLLAIGVVAALALPAVAQAAGSYTVWTCRGPEGQPLSATAWQSAGSPIATMTDTCASGGELSVVVPAGRSGTYLDDAGARFQAMGGSAIIGYRLWRSTTTAGSGGGQAGFYTDVLEDDFGFFSTSVDPCRNTSGCFALGDPSDPLGAGSNLVERSGVSLRSVSVAAGCSAPISGGFTCADTGGLNAAFHLYRAAVEIADASPPALVGSPSGPLLGGAAVGGLQTVTIDAADAGGGVAVAQARVDGALVAEREAGGDCRAPYTRPAPCSASATLALAIDTTALSDGEHQLELTVLDAAGNAVTTPSTTVRVDNTPEPPPPPPPPVTVTTPAPPPQTVTTPAPPPVVVVRDPPPPAGRGDYRITLDRRRVAAGAATALRGRVTERDGGAVAGASLVVERRLYGPFGGDWEELRTLTADATGRFRLPVPEQAQQLRVRLEPARAASTAFVSPAVDVVSRLGLRAAARPGTLRNGGTVQVTGQLRNAGPSARGKEVLVQAIVGGHWDTIDRVIADRRGAFSWRYQFQRTRTEALYSFRVVVAADQARWPWPTLTSSRLRVRVKP